MKKWIALGAVGALSLVLVGYAGAHHIVNNYAEVHGPPAHWSPLTVTDGLIPAPSDADAAIQTVAASAEGKSLTGLFPEKVGRKNCVIPGGGPAPGIRVPGTCETSVVSVGGNLEVNFTERWEHLSGDAGTGEKSHTWTFTVDPDGKIINRSDSGNFPPQNMR